MKRTVVIALIFATTACDYPDRVEKSAILGSWACQQSLSTDGISSETMGSITYLENGTFNSSFVWTLNFNDDFGDLQFDASGKGHYSLDGPHLSSIYSQIEVTSKATSGQSNYSQADLDQLADTLRSGMLSDEENSAVRIIQISSNHLITEDDEGDRVECEKA